MNYLNEQEEKVFKKIDIYNWFSDLVKKQNVKRSEIMRKIKLTDLKKAVSDTGYVYNYSGVSKIFLIQTRFSGVDYFCELILKDGSVNCTFSQVQFSTQVAKGHSLYFVCKHFYVQKTGDDPRNIPFSPIWFRDLEQLGELLDEVMKMYEKYKVASYELGFWE